jgi:hypothetical protein
MAKHYYADYGLLEYNSFYNERPRDTGNPVTLLNIDTADGCLRVQTAK